MKNPTRKKRITKKLTNRLPFLCFEFRKCIDGWQCSRDLVLARKHALYARAEINMRLCSIVSSRQQCKHNKYTYVHSTGTYGFYKNNNNAIYVYVLFFWMHWTETAAAATTALNVYWISCYMSAIVLVFP